MAKNKHDKTPCQWAEQFGQSDAAEAMRKGGGDPPLEPVRDENCFTHILIISSHDFWMPALPISSQKHPKYHSNQPLFSDPPPPPHIWPRRFSLKKFRKHWPKISCSQSSRCKKETDPAR